MKIGDLPVWPEQAARSAPEVDGSTLVVLGVCTLLAAGVLFFMLAFLVRYRAGSNADRRHPPTRATMLEVTWTTIPILLGCLLFWVGAKNYYAIYEPPGEPDLTVEVVGKQWMWLMHYPEGQREINTLHVPVGRQVRLRLISQDVIHSFFIPAFRVKHDVLPGRYQYLWFTATRPGKYRLFCAEYCGTSHSNMDGWVQVMPPEQFAAWREGGGSADPQQRGRQAFVQFGCENCHHGIGSAAPRLEGLWGRSVHTTDGRTLVADEQYIRESILHPRKDVVAGFQPLMPTYEGRLSEEQLLDLMAYLRSLGGQP